jgi:putative addiction module component (TIGR02574 family)
MVSSVRLQALAGQQIRSRIEAMTKAAHAVLAEALRLDADARAEVAAELLASLDGPADPDAEAAWAVEIDRRVAAIEAGTSRLEPWEEVKRRIERDPRTVTRAVRTSEPASELATGSKDLVSFRRFPGESGGRKCC